MIDRRNFIKAGAFAGLGITLSHSVVAQNLFTGAPEGRKVGIIGLDTSHCIAFTKALNSDDADFGGFKVVAAFPTSGSKDIPSSIDRVSGFTEQIREQGVEIVNSVEQLLGKTDVILLETVDGRKHLEQALPVLKAGKRMFIDKPMAASLSDAMVIFDAASRYGIPVFSASSLRYIQGMDEIKSGIVGKVLGAETYSPATVEKSHPDLFWYGIHGVEPLFTAMGTGCKTVTRTYTPGADVVVGTWKDGRIGTFRGIREGKTGYGGCVYGEKAIKTLGTYNGYNPLLKDIIKYFDTGEIPVQPEETLEILAFMEAADESKKRGGKLVLIEEIMERGRKESKKS